MKIRDAGALREKALHVQQKLDVSHLFTVFYHDLPTSCDSWDGHTLATCDRLKARPNAIRRCCTATPGIILSRSDLLSHNLDLIQSHVHIHRSTYLRCKCQSSSKNIHSRVHQKSAFQGRDLSRFAEVMGIGLPLISPERTWLLRLRGHTQFWRCFWDASLGVFFWVVMYHVHVHQVSIRSWKSSPKYLHTEAKKGICLVGFVQMAFSCRIWGIPRASWKPINYPSILRFPILPTKRRLVVRSE